MNTRLYAAFFVAVAICPQGITRAERAQRDTDQPAKRNVAEVARGDAYVSLIKQDTGEPMLVINYPWKRHARPSVEVRILGKGDVDNPLIRPLFFRRDIMKGAVTTAVYHCQDRSEDVPQTATFSKGTHDFEIFGARNSLGRPAVCVACRWRSTLADLPRKTAEALESMDDEEITSKVMPPSETWAVFCLLDAWAADRDTLYLELPRDYFAQQSKIRVWFLRDDDVVWTANATWPGTGE